VHKRLACGFIRAFFQTVLVKKEANCEQEANYNTA